MLFMCNSRMNCFVAPILLLLFYGIVSARVDKVVVGVVVCELFMMRGRKSIIKTCNYLSIRQQCLMPTDDGNSGSHTWRTATALLYGINDININNQPRSGQSVELCSESASAQPRRWPRYDKIVGQLYMVTHTHALGTNSRICQHQIGGG